MQRFLPKLFSRSLLTILLVVSIVAWQGVAEAAQLKLLWNDASNNEAGFKIERKTTTTGSFVVAKVVDANITTNVDTALTSGTTYCYRVFAFNSAGNSAPSNEVCSVASDGTTTTLTVTKTGSGSGTVTSNPTGINCGTDCAEPYAVGKVLTLTAAPAAGMTFTGWSGHADCTDGSVTMAAAMTCTANFTTSTTTAATLTVTKTGSGSGTVTSNPTGINCGTDCAEPYAVGKVLTLTAAPAAGTTFTGWSGACSGTGTCTVTVQSGTGVTANFTTSTTTAPTLTVTKTGSGTVSSNPTGINCGTDCTEPYTAGKVVTLTATPAAGTTFTGWSGACSGTGTCTVTVQTGTIVMANFASPGLKIGVFRPSTGKWYLDLNGNGMLDSCTVDACIDSFSQIGGKPVVGDWKGTGAISLGVFDPKTATWKLDGNGNDRWEGCTIDICLGPYGNGMYAPVAGRWQTNLPADRVGFYNPGTGNWKLDYNGNGKYDDCSRDGCPGPFGNKSQLAVIGDWTGTKQTRIGTFTPSTGEWVLDLNGNGKVEACTIDGCYGPFGVSGDLPVSGDWDRTGKSRIGIFDPVSRQWELDLNGNGKFDGCTTDRCLGPFGQAGDLPVVGNW